jgi:phenylalanyl-tRNA synthetase beta chain
MKLSLAWIFDHIAGKNTVYPFTQEFVDKIVATLGSCTTEIDQVVRVETDPEQFVIAVLKRQDEVDFLITEAKKEISVPVRKGALLGSTYLLIRDSKNYRYATLADLSGEKDGLVPELWAAGGDWLQKVDPVDYIITIDNKALTHRPDLWGHRGFAREIAALFSWELLPEDEVAAALPIRHYTQQAPAGKEMLINLSLDGVACKRLAALSVSDLNMKPSVPWMAFRLARVDSRPLNAIVDATNYVMFDIGQPMHAFDAHALMGKSLQARLARPAERLTLLDGEIINLTSEDCVIADAERPLALAGVMGGRESGVSSTTRELLVESANFDADLIRKSSVRYKRRTESSTRFEKGLDPNQNTFALLRFVRLLVDLEIPHRLLGGIASLGDLATEFKLEISHQFIVERIGMQISSELVVSHLNRLGFGITTMHDKRYVVSVPTFRSRDIKIKEDVVEEIARMIGYNALVQQLPSRLMKPFDIKPVLRMRALKKLCAFGLHMHEVCNYAFYDEEWLQRLGYAPGHTISVRNPVSENWRRMVTSLVPHLLKNVAHNVPAYEQIRLFELGATWSLASDGNVQERKKLALLFFTVKTSYSFYEGKAHLQSIFDMFGILVVWRKAQAPVAPWYLPETTAELLYNGQVIGHAGMLSPKIMRAVAEGEPFVAELDCSLLLESEPVSFHYQAVSKYQAVDLDLSMLVPFTVTIDDLKEALAQADGRIIAVKLQDFFESPSWPNSRAVTLRFTLSDRDKTFTKEEIDAIWSAVVAQVTRLGAQVR